MVFNEILWNLLWKTREYNNSGSPGFCEQRFQDCAVRQGGAEIPLFQRALEISWTGKKPLRHCATNLLPITAINSPQNISKIFSKQTTTIYDICCRFDFQVVLSGALTDISHLPFCQLTIFQKKKWQKLVLLTHLFWIIPRKTLQLSFYDKWTHYTLVTTATINCFPSYLLLLNCRHDFRVVPLVMPPFSNSFLHYFFSFWFYSNKSIELKIFHQKYFP